MTAKSRLYRKEQQEFAQGDRIRLTESNAAQRLRKGDFRTITAMSEADGLEIRLDKGQSVQLTKEQARYIEHGYDVESIKTGSPERTLISQDSSLDAASEVACFARTGRGVSIYTSDGSVQTNAQDPSIAVPEQLRPSLAFPEQQQSEAPGNIVAPEQRPAIHHRHGR